VRSACIDIGSNTTRLLVADCGTSGLQEVAQERVFTHIGRSRRADGTIDEDTIHEVALVVGAQVRRARELGAGNVRAVATAAIRAAPNGSELAAAVGSRCGVEVEILSGEDEARLAFLGAASALEHPPDGELGVVDVGGGSCELVVGTAPDAVRWSASFALGSSDLTYGCLHSDPPAGEELAAARKEVASTFDGLEAPSPAAAVAVGGSAASLARLVGPVLDPPAFARSLQELAAAPAREVAFAFGLDVDRVRLMPAGLIILEAASAQLGVPLHVGRGGLREGVILEGANG
jgi:exopolyphosphatase/guanosine-5'-triphosphate,3'-diphosphate pyrophosphatase